MNNNRFIHITNNPDEPYQLAILADFVELTYSVVVVSFNHTHTGEEHHVVATFYNVYDATREYHRLIGEHNKDKTYYQKLFEHIQAQRQFYV